MCRGGSLTRPFSSGIGRRISGGLLTRPYSRIFETLPHILVLERWEFMEKRDIVILVLAIAIAFGVGFWVLAGSGIETGSWGLSFRQEGAPPTGNAGRDQLAAYDAAYLGDPARKVIYLTFDAGYENGSTAKILDVLKEQQVPAAFFLVATTWKRTPTWYGGWWTRATPWATTPCTTMT